MKSLVLTAALLAPLAPAATPGHAQRFAAAYARQNDAEDVLAAVRSAQASGTDDEKGWAANLLSTCTFAMRANLPPGLSAAGRQDWQAAGADAQRRCAGVIAMKRSDYEALGDELRAAGIASTSEFGRLRRIGATDDGMSFRPATHDELATLTAAVHDDDPVVAIMAANVMSGLIDQASDRRHGLAFLAAAVSPALESRAGRLDALFACRVEGWCEHTHGDVPADAERTPKSADDARLQRAYADALARGTAMEDVLKIR